MMMMINALIIKRILLWLFYSPTKTLFLSFSWLSFVRYRFYLGFVINPKQNGSFSFFLFLLGKPRPALDTLFINTIEIVVTR